MKMRTSTRRRAGRRFGPARSVAPARLHRRPRCCTPPRKGTHKKMPRMCYGSKNQNIQGGHLMRRRDFIKAAIGTAAVWPVSSRAESYPSRPITLIVPFAAGGPTDVLARILAENMRTTLGQTVVIENDTGASGTIAGMRAARAGLRHDGGHGSRARRAGGVPP